RRVLARPVLLDASLRQQPGRALAPHPLQERLPHRRLHPPRPRPGGSLGLHGGRADTVAAGAPDPFFAAIRSASRAGILPARTLWGGLSCKKDVFPVSPGSTMAAILEYSVHVFTLPCVPGPTVGPARGLAGYLEPS